MVVEDGADEPVERHWKTGDRVYAVWAGNGSHYAAIVGEVDPVKKMLTVASEDKMREPSAQKDTAVICVWSVAGSRKSSGIVRDSQS
jgi:hypothetical protein